MKPNNSVDQAATFIPKQYKGGNQSQAQPQQLTSNNVSDFQPSAVQTQPQQ